MDKLVENHVNNGISHSKAYLGLTMQEASLLLAEHGLNRLESTKKNLYWKSLLNVVQEPMFILLVVACTLYFFLGDLSEAIVMLLSIAFVAGIEVFQETKSEKALAALRVYTEAKVKVKRDGAWVEIESTLLVPGDVVAISEGERILADGIVLQQNDLSLDESVLTGESLPVEKVAIGEVGIIEKNALNQLYQGTTVAGGKGLMVVNATGNRTEFGKLGKSIESIEPSNTPFQRQIKQFVRFMGIFGGLTFILVLSLNLWLAHDFWKALLFSLTIAMALIPEEIPVAFSAFMGLGAYRMIQHGILAKQPKTVESLGSSTVICLDKTGTITENKMLVAEVQDFSGKNRTLQWAYWASEIDPFDAMEQAIEAHLNSKTEFSKDQRSGWQIVKEYALSGKPPMMTHVWQNPKGETIVATKGAIERIIEVCKLDSSSKASIQSYTHTLAARGYRVLGVASATWAGRDFPEAQDGFEWAFEGLVAFHDPPKENVAQVFEQLYQAGIRVIMITGDHVETAKHIAAATGLKGYEWTLTGDEVMNLSAAALRDAVRYVNVYARMFPDAKLQVVKALQANGETVAMSGDGVNDGPALKAAQIGVAMGKKGTEIAKTAASLVLLSDNLQGMVIAIEMGRRIYENLRKAIRYVISIHIPIILLVLIPLLLQWQYPHILLPLHVIFLELVMDPVAAIAFENEPAEHNLMKKPPRPSNASLFSWSEMGVSILQGGMIAIGVLCMYHFAIWKGYDEPGVRAYVFATMVWANLFLTLTNRSFDFTMLRTLQYKNKTLPFILVLSIGMLLAILYIAPIAAIFNLTALPLVDFGLCMAVGFGSVAWFEVYKGFK